ncbi:hypothetical protein MTR67_009415 [Solanum verrucosum]|uniref:RING-type E3 ubiquitin transferase n=1 Tax=Solanum verrucosum TaxID=315347 RepID=A0AAF0TK91_SOLVR|nr:hypothetical protein MTR67_009415 [Solanum verrucosum]
MLLEHSIAMENSSAPSSLQNPSSRFKLSIFSRTQFLKFQYGHLILFIFVFSLNSSVIGGVSYPPEFPQIPYPQYCNDVVPSTPLAQTLTPFNATSFFLTLTNAYIHAPADNAGKFKPKTLNYYTENVYPTQNGKIFKIEGGLRFAGRIGPEFFGEFVHRRQLRLVYHRPPRFPTGGFGNSREIRVSGFWDSGTGKLCMVGSGLRRLSSINVVLKLNYLNSSDILHSVVNGTLERIDVNDKNAYTKPVEIFGTSLRNYVYTLIDKEVENNGFSEFGDWSDVSLGIDQDSSLCSVIGSAGTMEMMYLGNCGNGNCDFLGGNLSNFRPTSMWLNAIECGDNGRGRFLLSFGDGVHTRPTNLINQTIVAEGKWNEKTKTVDMIGCRIFNGSDAAEKGSVGDCVVRLSLRLPKQWTLKERSVVVGEIWKRKDSNQSGIYGKVVLHSVRNLVNRIDGLTYEYTVIDNVTRSCAKALTYKGKGGKYPDVHSSDMRFDMTVRNRKKIDIFSYSSPLSVGDKFYRDVSGSTVQVNDNQSTVVNISYVLHFVAPSQFLYSDEHTPLTIEISAEGLYDSKSGHLCMVGCMYFSSRQEILQRNSLLDCEILVNIQYPPLNAKVARGVRGTIECLRKKSDPLYFEPLELISNSVYIDQAKNSMWRMDLEMTMVLISNTLACIFVGLQLFYVRKNPTVLPFISVVMLVVLTLAHMIPLLLNFEALFLVNREKQNVYFGSDGWLEVNEILIRIMTMIAFLLEFRLLQLTWSARAGVESPKNYWISDKKVLYLSLPMYICGGLIAYFIHLSRMPHQLKLRLSRRFHYQQQTFWVELKSYAGLILDGFLLPQILFNLFCNTTERALTPGFYIGTTLVRLMPHVYDLYRSHSNAWSYDYIYGNPKMDYYSTAWDIIICCGGLLLAVLVFLQQRFGGRCFLPRRYRDSSTYEKVPVVSTESITEA